MPSRRWPRPVSRSRHSRPSLTSPGREDPGGRDVVQRPAPVIRPPWRLAAQPLIQRAELGLGHLPGRGVAGSARSVPVIPSASDSHRPDSPVGSPPPDSSPRSRSRSMTSLAAPCRTSKCTAPVRVSDRPGQHHQVQDRTLGVQHGHEGAGDIGRADHTQMNHTAPCRFQSAYAIK